MSPERSWQPTWPVICVSPGADEEGTIARLKALRHELIDPAIARCRGRIFKTTGDGILIEFASAVDAVRCAIEVQRETVQRIAGLAPDQRIEFRVGGGLPTSADRLHRN